MYIDVISIICEYCDINILYNIYNVFDKSSHIMNIIKPIVLRDWGCFYDITSAPTVKFVFDVFSREFWCDTTYVELLTTACKINNIETLKILCQNLFPIFMLHGFIINKYLPVPNIDISFTKYMCSIPSRADGLDLPRLLRVIFIHAVITHNIQTMKFIGSLCDNNGNKMINICQSFTSYNNNITGYNNMRTYACPFEFTIFEGHLEILDVLCRLNDHVNCKEHYHRRRIYELARCSKYPGIFECVDYHYGEI